MAEINEEKRRLKDEILASGRCVCLLDEERLRLVGEWVTWAVQWALFAQLRERLDMTYEAFLCVMGSDALLRRATKEAVIHGICRFTPSAADYWPKDELQPGEERHLQAARLYSDEENEGIGTLLLFRAELSLFFLLREQTDCRWEQFLERLKGDSGLQDVLLRGFRNGLRRLDMTGDWDCEAVAGILRGDDDEAFR